MYGFRVFRFVKHRSLSQKQDMLFVENCVAPPMQVKFSMMEGIGVVSSGLFSSFKSYTET